MAFKMKGFPGNCGCESDSPMKHKRKKSHCHAGQTKRVRGSRTRTKCGGDDKGTGVGGVAGLLVAGTAAWQAWKKMKKE